MLVPIAKPFIGPLENRLVKEVLDKKWISSNGKYVGKFESEIKKKLKAKNCVTCSNGTMALFMALKALGIGNKDEVIVPDLSFAATINSVINVGAKPVLSEVDLKTWCIDTKKIISKITKRTKAIICVHLYGNPCDMKELISIKKKYNLYLIEDAAESFGSKYNGKFTGTIGDVGCISFFANKTITTGEGGCCITERKDIYKKLLLVRNNGINPKKKYYSRYPGLNLKMTNIQAAIGFAQLRNLEKFYKKRVEIENYYDLKLNILKNFIKQKINEKNKKIEWLYTIIFKNSKIIELIKYLKKNNIETRRVFYPFHQMAIYKKYIPEQFDKYNSNFIFKNGISLPTYFEIKNKDQKKIVKKILEFFQ